MSPQPPALNATARVASPCEARSVSSIRPDRGRCHSSPDAELARGSATRVPGPENRRFKDLCERALQKHGFQIQNLRISQFSIRSSSKTVMTQPPAFPLTTEPWARLGPRARPTLNVAHSLASHVPCRSRRRRAETHVRELLIPPETKAPAGVPGASAPT